MVNRATHPPCPSCENLAEFGWWKIFYFIFWKPIKLTSAVGVRLMGQYKHTNINLTTGIGSDWLICHIFKMYVSPTITISYNGFDRNCALRCIYKYVYCHWTLGWVELPCWCNSSNYSPNNAQTSHWKLCLHQVDMEGYIYKRQLGSF